MALDRFIYFTKRPGPTKDEIELVLTNFMGGVGEIKWDADRFFILLPGKTTHPLKGIKDTPAHCNCEPIQEERWIEVWISSEDGTVDVMTRQHDDFTNALAQRIHEVIKRWWEGSDDSDGSDELEDN